MFNERRDLCAVLPALSLVALKAAQKTTKPNFTGTWILNLKKSTLQIPQPTSTTFRIRHDEPDFHLSRTHVHGDQSNTWSMDLTTDGKEHYQKDGDIEVRARLSWQGTSLLFDVKFNRKGDEGVETV